MRLMNLIGFRHLLPHRTRNHLRRHWNTALRWEQYFRERQFYRPFVRRGDLVFDVGANRGSKTTAFLALGARVVAIEPNPVCAKFLRENYGRAVESGQLHIEEAAASSNVGELILTTFDSESEMCSGSADFLRFAEQTGYKTVCQLKTRTTTLDHLIQNFGHPKFVKIDVEGMDASVMRGLTQRPEFLSFEYNTDEVLRESTRASFGEAIRLGFTEANFTTATDTNLRLRDWIGIDAMSSLILQLGESGVHWGDVLVR